jgi:N-acetylmuramoyl-L-alanine amidase
VEFGHAEVLRASLEQRPESARTRADYQRVLNAYRAVYHGDPGAQKASASVYAVAELLAEEGRIFHSPKTSLEAAGQFDFLLREYPTCPYRITALYEEGEIYRNDLGDRTQAKAIFQNFLAKYPRHSLTPQVRTELTELSQDRGSGRAQAQEEKRANKLAQNSPATSNPAPDDSLPARNKKSSSNAENATRIQPAGPADLGNSAPEQAGTTGNSQPADQDAAKDAAIEKTSLVVPSIHSDRPSLLTGIRYWSTRDYTRIAVDLGDQVPYETARVPNPDRIYFDLRGTHLSRKLARFSIAVNDEGYLKRIRAAQYTKDTTRIVLDVGPKADYTAFFLPNPWRLIIDIRNRSHTTLQAASAGPASPPIAPGPTSNVTQVAPRNSAITNPAPSRAAAVVSPTKLAASDTSKSSSREEVARLKLPQPTSTPTAHTTQDGPIQKPSPAIVAEVPKPSPATVPNDGKAERPLQSTALPSPGIETRVARPAESAAKSTDLVPPRTVHERESSTQNEQSLARTLGLKVGRIVIDPGHGGHDCGTLGPGGLEEKDIVLDVALRLGHLLKERLGADIIYTRDDDTFVPLQERTAIANKAKADLFISIHANSSSDPSARGVESYYLNFTTSPDALEVAARENAVSDQSIFELSDLVKEITLKDKIEESKEFATDVQKALYTGLRPGNPGLRNRGVKKAPFVVLIGANMPSILAEISFLTNPADAHELRQSAYRERIAEALYRGVGKYIDGINGNGANGIRIAANIAQPGNE